MRKKLSTEKRECSVKRRKLFTGAKAKPDKNYGPKADNPPPNIAKEDLEKLCDEKIKEYQMTEEEIESVQIGSIGQHDNELYNFHRKNRLTASLFGMICKRRSSTPSQNHVQKVLYQKTFQTADTNFGTVNENLAIRLFENRVTCAE